MNICILHSLALATLRPSLPLPIALKTEAEHIAKEKAQVPSPQLTGCPANDAPPPGGAQEQDEGQDGGPILAPKNPADIYRVLPPIPKMTLQPRRKCLSLKEIQARKARILEKE